MNDHDAIGDVERRSARQLRETIIWIRIGLVQVVQQLRVGCVPRVIIGAIGVRDRIQALQARDLR